jgi:Phospholipase_D-nuclease N-terminal
MRENVSMEPEAMPTTTAGKLKPKKKRWSDFSPRQQAAIVVGAIVELLMTTIALVDLAHRPARQVRGSKFLWLVTFVVQPVGPILYFLAGRRRTTL